MGSTHWSNDFYHEREAVRAKTGKSAFEYHEEVRRAPVKDQKVHEKLNPHKVMRESRDSKEHPNSVAIGVVFDNTGSMGQIPVELQKKLHTLMSTLLERGYIKDPQILFGAVGDTACDRGGSLQIGQFESGIEMDDDLGRMWLVGGGGPGMEESYQNALYFFARHTSIDCFEKRKKKGYLFLIGDELPYPSVRRSEVKTLMGDDLQEDLSIEAVIKEVQERFHLFFIVPAQASNGHNPRILNRWGELIGPQHVIVLDDPEGVCETVTMVIGLCEEAVNLDNAKEDLRTAGSKATVVNAAAAALKDLAKSKKAGSRVARL